MFMKNSDLDKMSVLQKYICVIPANACCCPSVENAKVYLNNTKIIPLEEEANLIRDTFG